MNNCSCQVCNNTVSFVPDLKNGLTFPPLEESTPKKSVHDRLEELSDYIDLHRIPDQYKDELRAIMEEISSIDDQLRDLDKYDRGGGELTLDIGEISKKLY